MLRHSYKTMPIIAILAGLILMVALACSGDSATPTSEPTSPPPTSPAPTATATAVPEPTQVGDLTWMQQYMQSAGYKPEWGEPQTGGILKTGMPLSMSSFLQHAHKAFYMPMEWPINNNLVRFDPWVGLDSMVPDLAKSWSVSDGGRKITFQLEEGVKFHDNPNIPERLRNAELTCEDVSATIERIARPPETEPKLVTGRGRAQVDHISSVSCPDGPLGYTAVMNLDVPKLKTMPALASTFVPMLDKDYIEWLHSEHPAGLDTATNETYGWLTGTGPMVPQEFIPDVSAKLRRNPTYFREGLPLLDGIDNFILKDPTTRFTALATGQINLYGHGSGSMLNGQVAQAQRDFPDQIQINAGKYSLGYGAQFNSGRFPFDDVRVRKAMHLAVDRDDWLDFNEAGIYNRTAISSELMVNGPWGFTEEEIRTWPGFRQPKDQDIAEANRLLDQVFGAGNRFSASCYSSGRGIRDETCLFIKDQMKRHLDIDVNVEPLESAVASQRSASCNWDISGTSLGSVVTGDADDHFFAKYHREHAQSGVLCQLAGVDPVLQAQIEEDIEAQSVELDPVKRREMTRALDFLLANEVHNYSMYGWLVIFYGTTPDVKGFFLMDIPMEVYGHVFERMWLAN